MDRLFDRAFNRAHGVVSASVDLKQEDGRQQHQQQQQQQQLLLQEEVQMKHTGAMTAEDAVERIDVAFKEGDFFK
jgi:hypothetical protein